MGTHTGNVLTLANSIIGVSVLAMPFCFKQCGIVLATLMLLFSNIITRLACHYLMKSAIMEKRKNFEMLAFRVFGPTGKLIVELSIIGFLLGTCVAYFVIMGDLGPGIVSPVFGFEHPSALRPSVLIGIAVFVVLPLGLLKNVDSLSAVCAATIAFYFCLVLKVLGEAVNHLIDWDWTDKVYYWKPSGILQCIPIFSMALSCQTQLFEVFDSLPSTPLDRMNSVVRSAIDMVTLFYISVGLFGYIAFCDQSITGNLLMHFSPTITSEVIKIGFLLSTAVSFPLVIFPCRASIYSFFFSKGYEHAQTGSAHIPETRFQCITLVIVTVSLVTGLLIPNIELVLGLVGSTIGVIICVIIPGIIFTSLSSKYNNDRLVAQFVVCTGFVILILGTYANLYATDEAASGVERNVAIKKNEPPSRPKLLDVEIKDETLKNLKAVEELAALPELKPPLKNVINDQNPSKKEEVEVVKNVDQGVVRIEPKKEVIKSDLNLVPDLNINIESDVKSKAGLNFKQNVVADSNVNPQPNLSINKAPDIKSNAIPELNQNAHSSLNLHSVHDSNARTNELQQIENAHPEVNMNAMSDLNKNPAKELESPVVKSVLEEKNNDNKKNKDMIKEKLIKKLKEHEETQKKLDEESAKLIKQLKDVMSNDVNNSTKEIKDPLKIVNVKTGVVSDIKAGKPNNSDNQNIVEKEKLVDKDILSNNIAKGIPLPLAVKGQLANDIKEEVKISNEGEIKKENVVISKPKEKIGRDILDLKEVREKRDVNLVMEEESPVSIGSLIVASVSQSPISLKSDNEDKQKHHAQLAPHPSEVAYNESGHGETLSKLKVEFENCAKNYSSNAINDNESKSNGKKLDKLIKSPSYLSNLNHVLNESPHILNGEGGNPDLSEMPKKRDLKSVNVDELPETKQRNS